MNRILIIGGYGSVGKIIAELLSKEDHIIPVIAGRDRNKASELAEKLGGNVEWRQIDAANQQSIKNGLQGVNVIINCIGTFMNASLLIPETAIELGIPYVDVSANHDYFKRILSLDYKAKECGAILIPSLGINPGIPGILLSDSVRYFDNIESSDIYFVLGSRIEMLSVSSGRELLSLMTAEQLIWEGAWTKSGEKSRKVYFSSPFAKELTVYPMWTPDLYGMPEIIKAKHIATWSNFESNLQGLLIWLGAASGCHKNDRRMALFLRLFNCVSSFYKNSNSGATIKIEIDGNKNGQKLKRIFELYTADELLATAIPPVIVSLMLVSREIKGFGVLAPGQICPTEKFLKALKRYGLDYSDNIEPI